MIILKNRVKGAWVLSAKDAQNSFLFSSKASLTPDSSPKFSGKKNVTVKLALGEMWLKSLPLKQCDEPGQFYLPRGMPITETTSFVKEIVDEMTTCEDRRASLKSTFLRIWFETIYGMRNGEM